MTAAIQTAPLETRYYFAGRCLFCKRNNRKRQTRKGRYWKCRHCGEINPGPGMTKAMMSHFTGPPANGAHANGTATPPTPAATAPTTTAVATRIKAAPSTPTPTPKPAPLEGAAAPAPVVAKKKAPAAKPPPKKPGFFEKVLYG